MSAIPISREVLVNNLKKIHGCLPIYKPKGIDLSKLNESFMHDLYFVIKQKDIKFGQVLSCPARSLEPFADGLVTLIVGPQMNYSKYFALSNYRYRATFEFGVERYYHSIDGDVMSRSNVDHINSEMIKNELVANFRGVCNQRRTGHYTNHPKVIESESKCSLADYYSRIKLYEPREPSSKGLPQKYPYLRPGRTSIIDKIELISYNKPYGEFDISCQGCFSVRGLAPDLAAKLNTKASVVQLTRLKEGPMGLDDLRLLQLHELNLEEYIFRMKAINWTYKKFYAEMEEECKDIQS